MYEGVGGAIREVLLRNMAPNGRMLQVGYISEYPHNPAPTPVPAPAAALVPEAAPESPAEAEPESSEIHTLSTTDTSPATEAVHEQQAVAAEELGVQTGRTLQAGCESAGRILQASYTSSSSAESHAAAATVVIDPLEVSDKFASVQARAALVAGRMEPQSLGSVDDYLATLEQTSREMAEMVSQALCHDHHLISVIHRIRAAT